MDASDNDSIIAALRAIGHLVTQSRCDATVLISLFTFLDPIYRLNIVFAAQSNILYSIANPSWLVAMANFMVGLDFEFAVSRSKKLKSSLKANIEVEFEVEHESYLPFCVT